MRGSLALSIAFVAAASLVAGPALAAQADEAAAEALFLEGRRLLEQGKYEEACAKLAASQKASPAVGTLLNLGECYERLGKTATAWAVFREAIEAGERAGRPDRAALARTRADALAPKLARMTVSAPKVEDLVVRRDDVPLEAAALGVALPVDPGEHRVEAAAPGRRPWSGVVTAVAGETVEISIPELERDASAPAASEDDGATMRTLGLVAGGVGLVGLGIGTFFGLSARSKWHEAQEQHCVGTICDPEGGRLAEEAKSSGNVATVAFVLGGAAIAGGIALVLLAPSRPDGVRVDARVAASPGGGGLVLGGTLP